MHRPAVEARQGTIQGQYGMGWHIKNVGGTRIVWHDGSVPDFLAYMAMLPDHSKAFVLLLNADHFAMVVALDEIGPGVLSLLAGEEPAAHQFGFIPWALRGLLLLPSSRSWASPSRCGSCAAGAAIPSAVPLPAGSGCFTFRFPLVPNLLLASAPVLFLRSGISRFLLLFGPDFSWIVLVCGGFAAVWIFVRTGLVLWTFRPGSS
jgi:hypothetical protein